MLVPILLFIAGLICLIKGGDWFVDGAVAVARRFHVSEMLIGATVVSIGTTLPEVMVSAQAALQHNSGISYGNAIGSIICNTSLIAALTVTFAPGPVNKKSLRLPAAAFFIAAFIYSLVAYTSGQFTRLFGICLLAMFAAYMFLSVRAMKNGEMGDEPAEQEEEKKEMSLGQELLLLVIGAAAIAVGANLLVENGTIIASALGVPDSVIGLTMVALGTSLPELVTSIVAAHKGEHGMAVGNVVGSNIFNLMFILGISSTIHPVAVNLASVTDLAILVVVSAVVFIFSLTKKINRIEGAVMVLMYIGTMAYAIIR